MNTVIDYDELDQSLRHCGSNWNAGQTHGLLCSRLAVFGAQGGEGWLQQILEDTDAAQSRDCATMLEQLYASTYSQLAERLSEFAPLLPEDSEPVASRTDAMSQWCEGFLHGLVATASEDSLKEHHASEPQRELLQDLVQITRATAETEAELQAEDEAYEELYEYLRVAAQLMYEELADFRNAAIPRTQDDAVNRELH